MSICPLALTGGALLVTRGACGLAECWPGGRAGGPIEA